MVSCHELDYTLDLGFDKIIITSLDPLRIREFMTRYLGADKGVDLFWKLAGQKAQDYHTDFIRKVGVKHERDFWLAGTLPDRVSWNYKFETASWDNWLKAREHPSSLIVLARKPYQAADANEPIRGTRHVAPQSRPSIQSVLCNTA